VKTDEIEKGNGFIVADTIEYVPNSIVSKILLKKVTGVVSIVSVDLGKNLPERTSPFDTLIQMIEGAAEVIIESKSFLLEVGQAVIIPAHARNSIKAHVRFKMISTIIKSGYEEVT
jgi:quercetin dioxygenase-like cupin family protein